MRGCVGKPRKRGKAGRGCAVVVKPMKKRIRRRRSPLGMLKPVIKGLRVMAP